MPIEQMTIYIIYELDNLYPTSAVALALRVVLEVRRAHVYVDGCRGRACQCGWSLYLGSRLG